jgi:hypothetical protein
MPPHRPQPGAGDTGPQEVRIGDDGYGCPTTPLQLPPQASSDALAVYDGAAFVGSITERQGQRHAFDARGERVGTFPTRTQAMRAIPAVRP